MFTAVAHKNLAGAEGYFVEHLAQNDYYAAGELRPGRWIGVAAQKLGLQAGQEVTRDHFYALCVNRHPQTGERLTLRQQAKDKRRVFFDFTCSPPKSVSILAVTLNDQRLVEAHEEAAKLAFRELESFAATRVRKQAHRCDRTTGNVVAASFLHTTSRSLDPQLHTHFTIFNATFDETEKAWKALQPGPMYEAIRYATEVYRNELARGVQALGFRTVAAPHGFEIWGVGEEVLRRFSKRAQERDRIVREMEQKLGRKLSNNEVAYAVHRSRTRKLTGISTVEVRARQLAQLRPEEEQSLRTLGSLKPPQASRPEPACEQHALAHAMAHLFERRSVVPEHELLAGALAHRPGEVDLGRLKRALRQCEELVPTGRGLSTQQILETELFLIQTVDKGRDAVPPLHPCYQPADWLSEEQRRVVEHVLSTGDRVIGLRGLAGTGKTTALRELANASVVAGIKPRFCAPTTAATEVLRKEGFQAVTLQSLLLSKPSLSERDLIVLDEAGAVGIDDMKRLFELARNSRIVLSGDTGQHASVARGDALRILEQYSRLESGQLTRIRRQQRAEYKHAVQLAAQKRTGEAFAQLEQMDAVVEFSERDLYAAAAQAYLKTVKSNKSALLIAPTWAEIESATRCVRNLLREQGLIDSQEHSFRVFHSLSWTQAQKRDAQKYRPGMVLRLHRRHTSSAPGESLEVVAVESNALTVRCRNGSAGQVNLRSASFDVGEERELKVALGDKLLLQANAAHKHFINGELVQVKAIEGETIALTDGRVIPGAYRSFTHGYAVTSHSAQSKTVSEVFLVAAARSLPAVHQQQFYVSISRGRERCHIFTDDKELLRAHISRSSARAAAVEVLRPGPVRQPGVVRRVLERAARVRELVLLNARLTLPGIWPRPIRTSQRLTHSRKIKPYGNKI